MKACLSIPDVLSRRDGVLAPSCEFDCNLDCEGSKGSLNGGGRMERVSSSSWEDIGDCCRDACCVPGGKEGSPRPRATASPSSGAPSVMSALLLVPVRNSSSPPSFSALGPTRGIVGAVWLHGGMNLLSGSECLVKGVPEASGQVRSFWSEGRSTRGQEINSSRNGTIR